MLLLDTCVISELRKPKDRMDPGVLSWSALADQNEAFLSTITLEEIQFGILTKQRRDPTAGAAMQRWFDRILASYSSRILAFDQQAALVAANLHLNRTHPKDDARIAAIAISHGLSVATRNTKDFEDLPVTVFDPFEYHAG